MVDFMTLLVERMAEISSMACVNMLGGQGTETSAVSYQVNCLSTFGHDALPLAITVLAFTGMGAYLLIKGVTDRDNETRQTPDHKPL